MKKYLIDYEYNSIFGVTKTTEICRYANDISHAYRIILNELEQKNNAAPEECKVSSINITNFLAKEICYDANVIYKNPII